MKTLREFLIRLLGGITNDEAVDALCIWEHLCGAYVASDHGYSDSYDWEFIPEFFRIAITEPAGPAGLTDEFIDYIGRTIAADETPTY